MSLFHMTNFANRWLISQFAVNGSGTVTDYAGRVDISDATGSATIVTTLFLTPTFASTITIIPRLASGPMAIT